MSLTAIKILKNAYPGARIFLITKQYLRDLFLNIPQIDTIVTIPDHSGLRHFFMVRKRLKKIKFEMGILFTNSFQSALLFRLGGIKKLTGYRKEGRGFLLSKKKKFPSRITHYVEFYTQIIDLLTGRSDRINSYLMRPVFTPQEIKAVVNKMKLKGISPVSRIIGINPGAAYGSAKTWSKEKFASLLQLISSKGNHLQLLLMGSAGEQKIIEEILQLHLHGRNPDAGRGRIFNLAGKLTLREALITVSLCSAMITNDSGFMHVAACLDIPLVAIYGPTEPALSRPLNGNHRVVYKPVECAPCRNRECPLDHRCMRSIQAEDVLKALESLVRLT